MDFAAALGQVQVALDARHIPACLRIWRFPKIRGTFSGVPIMRIILFWGLCWGPPPFWELIISGDGAVDSRDHTGIMG